MKQTYHRRTENHSTEYHIAIGDLWTTRHGVQTRVVEVARKGIASCCGCAYLRPDGQVDCHQVPYCKWWTREDGKNIIYQPINKTKTK